MNPKISVVIPCYNCSKTIDLCVISVMQQTSPVHEILLINDGSTDSTLDNLFSIKEKYKGSGILITIIDQENQGPSVARNKGLENAIGDWIAFLDSDDYWFEDKMEIQINVLKKHTEIDVISGDKKKRTKLFNKEGHKLIPIDFNKLCFRNFCITSSSVIRSEIAKNHRFNPYQNYSEDYRFFLQMFSNGSTGVYVDFPLSSSIENKRDFGDSGLSGNNYKMEKWKLSNYILLFNTRKISFTKFSLMVIFSLLKHVRKVLITIFYKIKRK